MKRAVLVILDGLRRDFVDAARTPHLAELAARAEWFPAYRTAFPSATRVVTATLATGCHPARHTLQGNAMALLENGALVPHDAGLPDFLQHKRAVTGHSLAVPTLAERLAPHGGAIIYNNVSPGAAYAHDPDGHGHVYHRAGSFAPGRIALDPLNIELDTAGDRAMTERFIADALGQRQPALAVLWLGEPDHIQHNTALGSPEHLAVLREADRHAGMAIAAVDRRRAAGDEVLLIVGSDHGHETVSGVVDIEAELIAAGLKSATGPNDVIAVSSGTSSLIYLHPDAEARRDRLGDFLASQPWAGRVIAAADLGYDRAGAAQRPRLRGVAQGRCIGERIRHSRPIAGRQTALGQVGPARVRPARRARPVRAVTRAADRRPRLRRRHRARGTGSRHRSRAQHHAASRHSGVRDGRPAAAASAVATRAITGAQSPLCCWRKMRSDGYHGLSSRPLSQRQQLS